MPPPPSYIDIDSTPFSREVTVSEFNNGDFGGVANEVWFRYITAASADPVPFGFRCSTGTGFTPLNTIFEDDGTTQVHEVQSPRGWWTLLDGSTTTYYLRIRNVPTGPTTGTFTVTADVTTYSPTLSEGTIIVNDDSTGQLGTVWSRAGTLLGIAPIVAGEIGDSLPSGYLLLHDVFGSDGSRLKLYDPTLTLSASLDTSPSLGSTFPCICNDGTQFYVLNRTDRTVWTVNGGTITKIATLDDPGDLISAIGVKRDGSVLYYTVKEASVSNAIMRWDLVTDAALSDFYTLELTNGEIASTAFNENPGEIIVQGDGTLVTWYRDDDDSEDVLVHVSAAGVLIQDFTFVHDTIDHLHYPASGVSSVTLWTKDPFDQFGTFRTINLETGEASTEFEKELFDNGLNVVGNELFGPATSCTLIVGGGYNPTEDGGGDDSNPDAGATRLKIRRLRRTPHLALRGQRVFIHKFQLDLEPGVGLVDGQGEDPQVMLRISRDGGHTWGNELWRSAGQIGEYRWRAIWYRLGVARDAVFEVSMSDPVKWVIVDAWIDVQEGAN